MGIPPEDVQAASRRFYEAVDQVMHADATAMLTLWSEQNDVTYCDPYGHVVNDPKSEQLLPKRASFCPEE
jgi:hypothetical protein